jgi:hypothetical protein
MIEYTSFGGGWVTESALCGGQGEGHRANFVWEGGGEKGSDWIHAFLMARKHLLPGVVNCIAWFQVKQVNYI